MFFLDFRIRTLKLFDTVKLPSIVEFPIFSPASQKFLFRMVRILGRKVGWNEDRNILNGIFDIRIK